MVELEKQSCRFCTGFQNYPQKSAKALTRAVNASSGCLGLTRRKKLKIPIKGAACFLFISEWVLEREPGRNKKS